MQNMVKVNTYISIPQISCYLIITKLKNILVYNITCIYFHSYLWISFIEHLMSILENTHEKKIKNSQVHGWLLLNNVNKAQLHKWICVLQRLFLYFKVVFKV